MEGIKSKISSLHWNHSHCATAQFGATDDIYEIGGGDCAFAKPEALETLLDSSMA
jgi:hypothetical protein